SISSNLSDAVFNGLTPDGGLYLPEKIPTLNESFLHTIENRSLVEIAQEIAMQFLCDDLSKEKIEKIIEEALNFPIPLIEIEPGISILELFHGPTLAFKDVAARF